MLYEYDAHNDVCPLPLVKTRVILKKMHVGDSCLIRIMDKGSKKNILHYLEKYQWQYKQKNVDKNVLEIKIHK
ncbi:MAG: hypothetical protein COB35_03415 [Gammaproteobacteria bacterium]|nr:MAG: hypothetical protein COB35_03415 [Gammaproteobacteria bacterium]